MASTLSNAALRDIVYRLKEDSYGAGDDSQRNIERDQVDALKQKVDDLTALVVELVGRIIA
jgi:hypothetical protein